MTRHNGMQFSTYDRDNDVHSSANCAVHYQGAWWFVSCHLSNLNGLYLDGRSNGDGVTWYYFKLAHTSLFRHEAEDRSNPCTMNITYM